MKRRGFDIEALRIEAEAPRDRPILATPIAAVTVMQMVGARDGAGSPEAGGTNRPLRPLNDAFDPEDRPILAALSTRLEGTTARTDCARQAGPPSPCAGGSGRWPGRGSTGASLIRSWRARPAGIARSS